MSWNCDPVDPETNTGEELEDLIDDQVGGDDSTDESDNSGDDDANSDDESE